MSEYFELWKKVVCHQCGCTEFYFQAGMMGDLCYHCRRCDKAAIPKESVEDGKARAEKKE